MTTTLSFIDQIPTRRALLATALIQAGKPIGEAMELATIRIPDLTQTIPDPFVTDEGVLNVTCGVNCWLGLYVDERLEVVKAWAAIHKYLILTDTKHWSPSGIKHAVKDGNFVGAIEITMKGLDDALLKEAGKVSQLRIHRETLLGGGEFLIQAFGDLPDDRFPLRDKNMMFHLRKGEPTRMTVPG